LRQVLQLLLGPLQVTLGQLVQHLEQKLLLSVVSWQAAVYRWSTPSLRRDGLRPGLQRSLPGGTRRSRTRRSRRWWPLEPGPWGLDITLLERPTLGRGVLLSPRRRGALGLRGRLFLRRLAGSEPAEQPFPSLQRTGTCGFQRFFQYDRRVLYQS